MSELVQAGGTFSNYPLSLPPAGSQQFAQLNVPYRSRLKGRPAW